MKKLLILTGGGDCPGLNAVIRAIARRADQEGEWKVYGSIEAYHGVMRDPTEIIEITPESTEEIHRLGGTIIKATTQGDPVHFPVRQADGTIVEKDVTDELVAKIRKLGFEAVISIGGDGSQRISQLLFQRGVNIIGVPKTIDNDLSATDFTFGFHSAVQEATDAIDKLVSTAKSHNRVIILELMGRDAGWISLYASIAGGAHVCLIPEIPYDPQKVIDHIHRQYRGESGYAIAVIAEGARAKDGDVTDKASSEVGYKMRRLGGVAYQLSSELKEGGCRPPIREMILGHLQRGGSPVSFDRILSTSFGVKAFEMVLDQQYGQLVVYRNNTFQSVTLEEATKDYKVVDQSDYLLNVARGVGISFGD